MRTLIIKNLPDWKLNNVIKEWHTYITNVGGDIKLENDNVVITWNDNLSVISHIIDFCDNILSDEWGYMDNLYNDIKHLNDNSTIIFNNQIGNYKINN